jgi:hypothetical protein
VARRIPTGALVLIGLGIVFLLHNLDLWFLSVDTLWPVFLIALGLWLFVKRQSLTAQGSYRHRSLVGPAVLVTVGGLALLDNLHGPNWDHTWPVILVVIGVVKLLERGGHLGGPPAAAIPSPPPASDERPLSPPPSDVNSEVKNG